MLPAPVSVRGHKPPIQLDSSSHDVLSFRVITIAQFTLFASFVVRVKKTLDFIV